MTEPVRPTSALPPTRYVILDDGRLTPEDGSPVRLLPQMVYLASEVDAKIEQVERTSRTWEGNYKFEYDARVKYQERMEQLEAEVARLTEQLAAAPAGGRPTADAEGAEPN